jgi:hypothetical protein
MILVAWYLVIANRDTITSEVTQKLHPALIMPGPPAPEAPVTSEAADSRYYTPRVINQPDAALIAI